jgi:capsule polysaccharide export protein KpsE/RkpR
VNLRTCKKERAEQNCKIEELSRKVESVEVEKQELSRENQKLSKGNQQLTAMDALCKFFLISRYFHKFCFLF